jgi:very-short-patch-repair endonuclease
VKTTDPLLLGRAKAMRSVMTQPERELWTALRAKRFGYKVRRQEVIGPYIVDFLVWAKRLIIEVDGDTHADPRRDERRTHWLEAQGYRVLRFNNADVMGNIEGVLTTLAETLAGLPSPNPLPHAGEGSPAVPINAS